MSFDNNISVVMIPYLYAVGAVLSALVTPLILKFILVAHTTDCYESTNLEQIDSTEQPWLLPLLFVVMTVSGAIAFHHALYWTTGLLYLLMTWTIVTECFLQCRLRVISDWLPHMLIWFGLLISIQTNPDVSSKSAILGVFISWSVANLLYIIAINLNVLVDLISTLANPLLLAVGGAILGIEKAMMGFILACVILGLSKLVDIIPIIIMKKINPLTMGFKYRLNFDFSTAYLIAIWLYWWL